MRASAGVLLLVSHGLAYRHGALESLELEAAPAHASPDAMPVLLLWFLVFDMVFLYLSNTSYTLMRENFFQMVSYTISIFCALLLEMSVTGLALEGFLGLYGGPPGLAQMVAVCFLLVLFPAWFFGISLSTWWVRESSDSVFAAGGIVSHMAAFAGIDLSKRVQRMIAGHLKGQGTAVLVAYLASPVVAMVICKVFSIMSAWIRRKKLMTPLEEKELHDGHASPWAHEAIFSELEGAAILSGFLIREAVLILVQKQVPKYSGNIEVPVAGPVMFLTVGGLLCAKSILASLPWKTDLVKFLQLLMGMTACWCFMSLIMYDIKQNVTMSDHRWLVLVAAVSGLALAAMFLMGYMADWRMLQTSQLQELVLVCGMATGLAWEKSFAWAIGEVVQNDALAYNERALGLIRKGSPLMADLARQLKLLEVWAYLMILAVMMPAWRWYIVPLANPHHTHA